MKTTSRFALVAAAGIMMGGFSLSAKAADLGGDCCADLEERVAELEATTVRKGNRKVSLELSGQVNKALMIWDDGRDSDAYIIDNNYSSTRFRLRGTGQIAPGWKAGFYMEYEFRDSSSNLVDQNNANNRDIEGALRIRQENVFIESATLGRVTIGQQSAATKDLTLINLGGGISDADLLVGTAFRIRDAGLGNNLAQVNNSSRLGWGAFGGALDSNRAQAIRYDTPSIYGFIASASWGQDDFWDVALRFQKEWNSIRIAAGVGYSYYSDPARFAGTQQGVANEQVFTNPGRNNTGPNTKSEVISGSISAIHIPTGLYASFAAGERSYEGPVPGGAAFDKDASYFYVQAGITKRFFDVGASTLYGEYAEYDDYAVGAGYGGAIAVGTPTNRVTSSELTRYGFGVTQAFDGAAMELYANYYHYELDVSVANAQGVAVKQRPEDFDAVVIGSRIKF